MMSSRRTTSKNTTLLKVCSRVIYKTYHRNMMSDTLNIVQESNRAQQKKIKSNKKKHISIYD